MQLDDHQVEYLLPAAADDDQRLVLQRAQEGEVPRVGLTRRVDVDVENCSNVVFFVVDNNDAWG